MCKYERFKNTLFKCSFCAFRHDSSLHLQCFERVMKMTFSNKPHTKFYFHILINMQFKFFLRTLLANIPETGFEVNLSFMGFETLKQGKNEIACNASIFFNSPQKQ